MNGNISKHQGRFKIDVRLREPIIEDAIQGQAKTIIFDPLKEKEAVRPLTINCLSLREALAEKFRAALTRNPPAVRDFFDIACSYSELKLTCIFPSYIFIDNFNFYIFFDSLYISAKIKKALE